MKRSVVLRFALVTALIGGSYAATAQTAPAAAQTTIPSDDSAAELVRSLSNKLQLQPHQSQILRRALEMPKGAALAALQKKFHDGLSPQQMARLEEWEKTAPAGWQQRFIALAE